MRCVLIAVTVGGVAGIVLPAVASADPIYLMSTRRVFVELSSTTSIQEVTAPDNGPFTATLTATDGINQATASLSSTLSPGGFTGFGVTSVTSSSLDPVAISQMIVNFLLTSPHTYSFVATMSGAGSNGGFLADPMTGENILTIPAGTLANVIGQGVLQPGQYQLITSLTNQRVAPGASSFQVSLQLAETGGAVVPEPGTVLMVASGGAMLWRRVRRRVHA